LRKHPTKDARASEKPNSADCHPAPAVESGPESIPAAPPPSKAKNVHIAPMVED
jgi:hypothetical protein